MAGCQRIEFGNIGILARAFWPAGDIRGDSNKDHWRLCTMKTGAHIIDGGCHFRVWAPNAKEVHVVGEFNNWAEGADALTKTNEGYWEGIVSNALVGQKYKYLIL